MFSYDKLTELGANSALLARHYANRRDHKHTLSSNEPLQVHLALKLLLRVTHVPCLFLHSAYLFDAALIDDLTVFGSEESREQGYLQREVGKGIDNDTAKDFEGVEEPSKVTQPVK